MFAEPRQTRFDRGRLELGRYHACRHSGIVDVDDGWEIGFERVADNHIGSCSRVANRRFSDPTALTPLGKMRFRMSVETGRALFPRFEIAD